MRSEFAQILAGEQVMSKRPAPLAALLRAMPGIDVAALDAPRRSVGICAAGGGDTRGRRRSAWRELLRWLVVAQLQVVDEPVLARIDKLGLQSKESE
jgi:hypothetical protein